jgi:hypothetical protein
MAAKKRKPAAKKPAAKKGSARKTRSDKGEQQELTTIRDALRAIAAGPGVSAPAALQINEQANRLHSLDLRLKTRPDPSRR